MTLIRLAEVNQPLPQLVSKQSASLAFQRCLHLKYNTSQKITRRTSLNQSIHLGCSAQHTAFVLVNCHAPTNYSIAKENSNVTKEIRWRTKSVFFQWSVETSWKGRNWPFCSKRFAVINLVLVMKYDFDRSTPKLSIRFICGLTQGNLS